MGTIWSGILFGIGLTIGIRLLPHLLWLALLAGILCIGAAIIAFVAVYPEILIGLLLWGGAFLIAAGFEYGMRWLAKEPEWQRERRREWQRQWRERHLRGMRKHVVEKIEIKLKSEGYHLPQPK
jgi:hypothetical protein